MKRNAKSVFFILLFAFFMFMEAAWGQDGRLEFETSHSVDWVRGKISSRFSFDLAQAGIKLPTRRTMGEDILEEAYPGLLRPFLLSLRLDSNTTIGDLVSQNEVSLQELDALCLGAEKIPPSLSADLTRMGGSYTVSMEKIGALLAKNRHAAEAERPLLPSPAADYTGIIIIAPGELPIHGRRGSAAVEPCLFPRIWDTNMTLVYDKNMFDPRLREERLMLGYAVEEHIFRATPSGLDKDLLNLVGPNPLRVLARGVFGVFPTDPVIDREDALKILSTENNRRLLREGRVLLVLNKESLESVVR